MNVICLLIVFFTFSVNTVNAQKTIIWKVTSEEDTSISHIIGTFHIIGNSFIDSIPAIIESIKSANTVIFESIDDKNQMISDINNRPISNEFSEHLSKKEQSLLLALSQEWIIDYRKLTSIELYLKLQQEYIKSVCKTVGANDSFDNFDNYLLHISRSIGKNIIGLETDSFQINDINILFNAVNWDEMSKWIKKVLKDIRKKNNRKPPCQIVNDYINLNLNYQFNSLCSDTSLIQRNGNWMPTIVENVSKHNTVIVVGILHLYGSCGIISQLRELGYTIEPVLIKN
jgi:uncharacterized protein YbaP (TraB family)